VWGLKLASKARSRAPIIVNGPPERLNWLTEAERTLLGVSAFVRFSPIQTMLMFMHYFP